MLPLTRDLVIRGWEVRTRLFSFLFSKGWLSGRPLGAGNNIPWDQKVGHLSSTGQRIPAPQGVGSGADIHRSGPPFSNAIAFKEMSSLVEDPVRECTEQDLMGIKPTSSKRSEWIAAGEND